jgi:predicted CXXCH cytochrome family protein
MPSRIVLPAGCLTLLLCFVLAPSMAVATPPTFLCLTGKCHPSIAEKEFVHGPIGSGMCPLCHDDGRDVDGLPAGHPGVSIETATEKCLLCHEEIGILMDQGSVHTPVADGDCIDCHEPHGGNNSFFLRYPPRVVGGMRVISATCKACHEAGSPDWFDEFHANEAILDCVVCHNAHGSAETFQLTRYVKEVYLKAALAEAADLRRRGKLDAAAEAYDKSLKLFPDDVAVVMLLAKVHTAQGEWGKARSGYEKVLSIHPGHLEALIGSADAARHLEGLGAELLFLKKAIEVEPDRADLHFRAGKIYQERGQLQEAVAEFSKAVRIDPDYVPAHRRLAEVYESMGMSRDAEEERAVLKRLSK